MPKLNKFSRLKHLLFIILFFSVLGCDQKTKTIDDVLPKDSLISIIVDMHLGDAILMEPTIQYKEFVVNKPEYYSFILQRHSVTKELFQESIDYYSQNPEEYEKMYDIVMEKITVLQGDFMAADTLKKDSIK